MDFWEIIKQWSPTAGNCRLDNGYLYFGFCVDGWMDGWMEQKVKMENQRDKASAAYNKRKPQHDTLGAFQLQEL